jgi:hypothetical protein
MLVVFGRDTFGWCCVWATSSRRGFALEKKRFRAFGDRLSVDEVDRDARMGIVKARAAPKSRMVKREKGRGMRKWMSTQLLGSHVIYLLER